MNTQRMYLKNYSSGLECLLAPFQLYPDTSPDRSGLMGRDHHCTEGSQLQQRSEELGFQLPEESHITILGHKRAAGAESPFPS